MVHYVAYTHVTVTVLSYLTFYCTNSLKTPVFLVQFIIMHAHINNTTKTV